MLPLEPKAFHPQGLTHISGWHPEEQPFSPQSLTKTLPGLCGQRHLSPGAGAHALNASTHLGRGVVQSLWISYPSSLPSSTTEAGELQFWISQPLLHQEEVMFWPRRRRRKSLGRDLFLKKRPRLTKRKPSLPFVPFPSPFLPAWM